MTLYSTCGDYAVEINDTRRNGYVATAVMKEEGNGYGNWGYWFRVGVYKTEKNAIRAAVKKMAVFGKELVV